MRASAGFLTIALLVVLEGCAASRAPGVNSSLADRTAVSTARSLVGQGCYACLREALNKVEPLVGRTPGAASLAFEAALLLTLREKELGLPATQFVDIASRTGPLLGPAFRAEQYLAIVDAVPWEGDAHRKDFAIEFRTAHRVSPAMVKAYAAFLRTGPADRFFNDYLSVAVSCAYDRPTCEAEVGRIAGPGLAPLLGYRLAIVASEKQRDLEAVLGAEPGFVEAHVFLGRYALSRFSSSGMQEAKRELEMALQHFPESPTVTLMLAGVTRAWHDWEEALRLYDRVLALVPDHEDALLGRTVALTQLQRAQEAVTTASRLIELGPWYGGEAVYWRAWNRLQLAELDLAREDVEEAKRTFSNADVFTLSGVNEFRRRQPLVAKSKLELARELDSANCTALWHLGLVESELAAFVPAAETFSASFECFKAATARLTARLAQIEAEDVPPAQKARNIAEQREEIDQSVRQEGDSAFNAAVSYLRAGNLGAARRSAEAAQAYDQIGDRATQVLLDLEKRVR